MIVKETINIDTSLIPDTHKNSSLGNLMPSIFIADFSDFFNLISIVRLEEQCIINISLHERIDKLKDIFLFSLDPAATIKVKRNSLLQKIASN